MSIHHGAEICNQCGGRNGYHSSRCSKRALPVKPAPTIEPAPVKPTAQPSTLTVEAPPKTSNVHVNADGFLVFNPNKKIHMAEVFAMLPEEWQRAN